MTEDSGSLVDTLSRVSSFQDLESALPQTLTDRLGEGQVGVNRTVGMLVGLAAFALDPATFDRDAFNAIVAFDYNADKPFPQEEAQEMLKVALDAGFLREVDILEQYVVNSNLHQTMQRLLENEE